MTKFKIGVEVTTQYQVEVEADTEQEAYKKAEDMEYDEMTFVDENVEFLDLSYTEQETNND